MVLLSTLASTAPAARAIDPVHSRAQFSVSHIWVERVTGTVPIVSGSVSLAADSVIPVSVSAVLDATKISTGEPDRDRSLESPDFFDVARFPQWTFASTKVVPMSASAFEMEGNLTIHGITRPERLQVTVAGTESSPTYHVTAQIDRHSFGMAVTRLDPVIGAVADVTLDVVLQ
jgi:polyisoprenoid-binding protein YceI